MYLYIYLFVFCVPLKLFVFSIYFRDIDCQIIVVLQIFHRFHYKGIVAYYNKGGQCLILARKDTFFGSVSNNSQISI